MSSRRYLKSSFVKRTSLLVASTVIAAGPMPIGSVGAAFAQGEKTAPAQTKRFLNGGPLPHLNSGLLPQSTATFSPLDRVLGPATGLNDKSTMPVAPDSMPRLRGLGPDDKTARKNLEDIADQATSTAGSIFVDQDNVFVKPPVLSALITLDSKMSPLSIDADANSEISLRDTYRLALGNNLPIKISAQDAFTAKYAYYNALTNFLPAITTGVTMQGLRGNYVSPAGAYIPIRNPYFSSVASFSQPIFHGGGIIYTARQQKHTYSASRYQLKGTTNDIMLDSGTHYYDLVKEDVFLQIRVKAVEVSKALVQVNQDLFDNGVNTELDVLQAKYQLSADRQKLIKQQIARREAAVKLATVLNQDQGVDLQIKNRLVGKIRLVDSALKPNDLLAIAIDKRPELKKWSELRLAAKDAVKVARSALFPQINFLGSVVDTGSHATSVANRVGSQTTPLVAGGGGLGVGSIGSAGDLPVSGSGSGGARFTTRSLYTIGVDVAWNLGGLGTTQITALQESKSEARKVSLEFDKELREIMGQVRDAYLSSMGAENLIIETSAAVKYAEEGLRLADLRFQEGVGTYLDVINAQHSYTDALIDKANAIVDFDVAQTKLLHAIGCLNIETGTAPTPLKRQI